MANTTFNFNVDPYYDDFEYGPREQNYMRILFRPGYAVQARELTQLQTILQNQIRQFGDHIFQDGSPVEGGHLTLDVNVKSLKLQPQYNNVDINLEDFDGRLIVNTSGSPVRANVVATDNTQTYPTIVVKYLSGNEFGLASEINVANTTTKALTNAVSTKANSSIVSINEGVFYVDGYFVYVSPQTIVLDAYSDSPSYRVGLQISDGIITESEDSTLLDPAQESFNYQAPGATRYQFNLELAKRSLTSTDDSKFFELMRVENGIVTKQVEYPIYSKLEETLARRTYDESGDYTVKPFRVSVSENQSVANTFKINIEPGKAYVKGYEFETIGTISITNQKANTTSVSTDYSFSLDYGNYLICNNLYSGKGNGFIDVISTTAVDLHTVPSANINTASSAAYSNTKIGTARIRNVDFASGTDYYVYLFDINTAPTVFFAGATSPNTSTINLGSTFSTVDNAYRNVKLKILSGKATDSYTRIITGYVGATKIATVDYPFATTPDTTSKVALLYSIDDVDSLVVNPGVSMGNTAVYYTQLSTNSWRTCMDVSFNGKTIDGKAVLYDSQKNKLYYELPQNYVSDASFSTSSQYYRKTNVAVSFTGGSATISPLTGGSWFFGTGALSSTTARNNFIVVDRGSGLSFDFSATGNTITQSGSTVTIAVTGGSGGGTFTADVIATEKVVNPVTIGSKTLRTPSTSIAATDTYTNGTSVTGTSNYVKIDASNGHVWFLNSSYIANTPATVQSLYLTDVIRIVKVFESGNLIYAPNSTNKIDITDKYILDGGQRENYYDYATVRLKDGYSPPSGQTVFFIEYFEQSGGTAYFAGSSYAGAYANNKIPNFATQTGIVSLRDVVDFRPRRKNSLTNDPAVFALEGSYIPSPEYSFDVTYSYYMPRIDKLVLTKDKQFKIIKGNPAIFPTPPKLSDDAMLLYNIYVPAYTANVSEIGLEYVENKRYTMKDIGNLEKRIENLEYYTSLNVLELQAKNETVLYEDNVLEKEKYGIIADDFSDFSVVDTGSSDLASNLSKGKLTAYKLQIPVKLNLTSSTYAKINDRTVSLNYSETSCVVQETATKSISVQPYEFAQFFGNITLYPETDYWYSKTLLPEVILPASDFVRVESVPGATQTTSAPEINPTASVVSAPATTGRPTTTTQTTLPADGFGAIHPQINWFGSGLNLNGAFTLNIGKKNTNLGKTSPSLSGGKPRIDVGEIYTRKKRN
jgi:hypothetical protein